MKIGLISDTHGNGAAVRKVVELAHDVDMWLHAGDCVEDAEYLEQIADVGVVKVVGNSDWSNNSAPTEIVVEVAGHSVFLTHGH